MNPTLSDESRSELSDAESVLSAAIKALCSTNERIEEATQLRDDAGHKVRAIEDAGDVPTDKTLNVLLISRARSQLLSSLIERLAARLKREVDSVINASHAASELWRRTIAQPLEEETRTKFVSSLPASLQSSGWQNVWSGSAERRALGVFLHAPSTTRNDAVADILSDAEHRLALVRSLLTEADVVVPELAAAATAV